MVVVPIHQTSKPHEIAKRLNAQFRSVEKTSDEMGRDLVLLKGTKPKGIEWGVYLKELGIEFGRDYADRLIRRVEGREKTPIKSKGESGLSPEPDIEKIREFGGQRHDDLEDQEPDSDEDGHHYPEGYQSPWKAHGVPQPADDEIPTEEEAEKSHQEALYDQACLFLKRMTGETRQRFFAYLRRTYHAECK